MIQRARDQAARLVQRGLGRNMAMAVAQAGIGIVALFVSYRIVVAWHGTTMLGLWSLIGAFTLSIRMLDPSGGATIGRFIAIAAERAKGAEAGPRPVDYADTALVLLFGLYTMLSALAWYPLTVVLHYQIVDPGNLAVALDLLPVMLALVIAMTVGGSCADALDGLNRADVRAVVMIAGYVVFLALVVALVPRYGLMGMAVAQLVQYALVAVAARLATRRLIAGLGFFPRMFRRDAAREMVGYGMKLQLASLANFLTDPLVRILLNHFGSLAAVGIYELANKLVFQIRSLISSGAMPLIPVLAVSRLDEAKSLALMRRANRGVTGLSVLLFAASMAGAPVLSWFVLGHIDMQMIFFSLCLALGYSINTVSLPLYLHNQARGHLAGNIWGQFSIGFVTLLVAPLLVPVLGIGVVVAAYALGLSLSAVIFIAYAARINRVAVRSLW